MVSLVLALVPMVLALVPMVLALVPMVLALVSMVRALVSMVLALVSLVLALVSLALALVSLVLALQFCFACMRSHNKRQYRLLGRLECAICPKGRSGMEAPGTLRAIAEGTALIRWDHSRTCWQHWCHKPT